jgi:DNA-binding CsgD family transcriptional regulator
MRTGRRAEAALHVAAMHRSPIFTMRPRTALAAACSAALVASGAEAVERFDAALAVPGPELYPFDRARVQLAYGEHLRRTRATAACRIHLPAARETFRRLGAQPWVTRSENELRAAGLHLGPASGDEGMLTAQEYEIASLAASGPTDEQIGSRLHLSPRTVAARLYRVFPELGITTRAALRDALDRSPLVGADPSGSAVVG